jgi:hypothetical protein
MSSQDATTRIRFRPLLAAAMMTALLAAPVHGANGARSSAQPPHASGHELPRIGLRDTDLEYLLRAARASRTHLRAAGIAMQSGDARVRALAQQLRMQNTTLLAELQRIADRHGVALTPRPTSEGRSLLDGVLGMYRLNPAEFDVDFVRRVGRNEQQERVARAHRFLQGNDADAGLRTVAARAASFATASIAAARALEPALTGVAAPGTATDAPMGMPCLASEIPQRTSHQRICE